MTPCRHPKARRTYIGNFTDSYKLECLMQWCSICGSLRMLDGTWCPPDLHDQLRSERMRRLELEALQESGLNR